MFSLVDFMHMYGSAFKNSCVLRIQAKKRPERIGGPSRSQFDGDVASKAPAVMRESMMASYGGRMVFRPTFDTDPLLSTQVREVSVCNALCDEYCWTISIMVYDLGRVDVWLASVN